MNRSLPIILALAICATPTWAAGALTALRARSMEARARTLELRAEQLERRNELSVLSSEIETLKTKERGKLFQPSVLTSKLQRSQDLSGVLVEISQKLSVADAELEAAQQAFVEELSGEMRRLRDQFDSKTDRAARREIVAQLRRLRAERDAVRQTLPANKVPALLDVRPSDEPEELLEQADLLRDQEEKLRRDLKAVESRLAERREEVALDKRVQRFLGEESMFDDTDRRLRVQRTFKADSDGPERAAAGPQFDINAQNAPPQGGTQSDTAHVVSGSDARVQTGDARPLGLDADDLSSLEQERARIEHLATQALKKATELEQRAATLSEP